MPIEHPLLVRLHRVPRHPIAEAPGLKVKSENSRSGRLIDNIQPERPFWMRFTVKEELGKPIGTSLDGRRSAEKTVPGPQRRVSSSPGLADHPSLVPVRFNQAPGCCRSHQGGSEAGERATDTPYFCTSGNARVSSDWGNWVSECSKETATALPREAAPENRLTNEEARNSIDALDEV